MWSLAVSLREAMNFGVQAYPALNSNLSLLTLFNRELGKAEGGGLWSSMYPSRAASDDKHYRALEQLARSCLVIDPGARLGMHELREQLSKVAMAMQQ